MVTVPKLWPGSTVVCIASGPSLAKEDVEYCRGRCRVIAVNDGVRLAPWADVLYSSDRYWWPARKGYPSFHGPKYGIGSTVGKRNHFSNYPEIKVLKNSGYDGLETEPTGLRNGKNSGYGAIGLAYHFGAARILLLGYDMGIKNGETHFFGLHQGMSNPTDSHFVTWRRLFKTMVAPLAELGVQVINCTEASALEAFPCGILRECLPATAEVAA